MPRTLFLALALLAHPIGPLWCLGTLAYLSLRKMLPGPWRFATAMASIGIVFAALYSAMIARSWSFLPIHGIVVGAVLLLPTYLLALLMLRRHWRR